MSLLGAWGLFPLLAAGVCLGLGLLADRIGGGGVPGALLLPLGLAALIAGSQTITYVDAFAELLTPAVVVLALAGLWLGRARLRPLRPDGWALGAAAAVFAVYAAPIVLSGSATFAGYTLLGDTAIHFILADWVAEHGPHAASLPPSSYQAALDGYLQTAYPLGAHAAWAAVAPFGLQPLPWVYQPFLALIATFASLGLYGVLSGVIRPRPLRALAAFVGAQPALMYGYALQGSIKELAVVALLVLLAGLVAWMWREGADLRRVLVAAIVVAAGLGVLNLAIAPYFGPLLLVPGVLILFRGNRSWGERLGAAAAGVALVLALSIPTLASFRAFTETAEVSLTSGEEFGNLFAPLQTIQALGIWPRGDYRFPLIDNVSLAYVLMGVVALGAVFGAVFLLRRFSAAPVLLAAAALIGSAYAIRRGSPWADGKALMIASPAVMAMAFVGVESLRRSRRGIEALVVAVAILGGVVWTNAAAFRYADLAPRERLEELADIGDRIDGQGPTLYTEFEEFAKYFLRDAAPTGSSESWQPPGLAQLAEGGVPPFGFSVEPDELFVGYVERHRTIVLRRSPTASRPPASYRLAFATGSYEVWQRPERQVLEVLHHEPLGEPLEGRAAADCGSARDLATRAREEGGRLAFVERPALGVWIPSKTDQPPPGWTPDGVDDTAFRPNGAGRVEGEITAPAGGRYEVWLSGSFGRPDAVELDGRVAGRVEELLSPREGYQRVGEVTLDAGRHRVALVRPEGQTFDPGSNGGNRLIGPVVLRPVADSERRVRTVAPDGWRSLCGRTLDWIEVVRDAS